METTKQNNKNPSSDSVECDGSTFDWDTLDQEEKLLTDLAAELLGGSGVRAKSELSCEVGRHSLPRQEIDETFYKVGKGVASGKLCGFWLRQALMAANEMPAWERIVLTVDSGASDTVMPPHAARNVPLMPSPKVGHRV